MKTGRFDSRDQVHAGAEYNRHHSRRPLVRRPGVGELNTRLEELDSENHEKAYEAG